MDQDQQSRLKELYTEVNDHLPEGIVEPEQIEDIIRMINDMGIKVHESAPTEATDILSDTETEPDEDAAEEAAAALASLDSEFGRTTDPVRMYMREMGTVELLTREGEIKIARRIENGLNQAISSLARYPDTMRLIIERYNEVREEEAKLSDLLVGFVDPEEDPNSIPLPAAAQASDDDEDGEVDDSGPDPEEAEKRFTTIERAFNRAMNCIPKKDEKGYERNMNEPRGQGADGNQAAAAVHRPPVDQPERHHQPHSQQRAHHSRSLRQAGAYAAQDLHRNLQG
jgi:RNA polymerase primary sigma factor